MHRPAQHTANRVDSVVTAATLANLPYRDTLVPWGATITAQHHRPGPCAACQRFSPSSENRSAFRDNRRENGRRPACRYIHRGVTPRRSAASSTEMSRSSS